MPAIVPPAQSRTVPSPVAAPASSPAAPAPSPVAPVAAPVAPAPLPTFREAVFDTPVPGPTTTLPFVLSYSLSPEAFPGLTLEFSPDRAFLIVSWPVAEADGPYDSEGSERVTFWLSASYRFYLRT